MTVYDLPFGASNIRLYTYDPGSTPMYNTGHYDLCAPSGNYASDPQAFNDWQSMADYTASKGEAGLVMVTRADLPALLNPAGTDVQRICHLAAVPITKDNVAATVVNASTAPSASPAGTDGHVGGGQVTIYRFIAIGTGPYGGYDTGANYANCSATNTAPCDGRHFATLIDAYNWAVAHNEVPVMVSGSAQAFDIIAGRASLSSDMILTATQAQQGGQGLSTTEMVLLGAAALFVLKIL